MGQAKRRAAEIAKLKASSLPAMELDLPEIFAIHECGHALAFFHYDVPIGAKGIYVRVEQWGNSPSPSLHGFCDSRVTEQWDGHNPEDAFCYRVTSLAGPMAEIIFKETFDKPTVGYLRNLPLEWETDFEGMGFTPKEFLELRLGLVQEEELPWATEEVRHYFRRVLSTTEELVRGYAGEIAELSQMVLRSPLHEISGPDLAQWFSDQTRRSLTA